MKKTVGFFNGSYPVFRREVAYQAFLPLRPWLQRKDGAL